MQSLNGIAWWAVMLFVMIAGIELDLRQAWAHRRESSLTAGLALGLRASSKTRFTSVKNPERQLTDSPSAKATGDVTKTNRLQ